MVFNRLRVLQAVNWLKPLNVLLALALVFGFGAPAAALPARAKAPPALLSLAASAPDQTLNVIVQRANSDPATADLVTRLGGTVTRDLSIINALAATLPARAVPELARAGGVRWVSLDAPLQSSQTGETASFSTWATAAGPAGSALNSLSADFDGTPIAAGRTIWFSSMVEAGHLGSAGATLRMRHASVSFSSGDASYRVPVPDGVIRFSPDAGSAATTYDAESQTWVTVVPRGAWDRETFVSGAAYMPSVTLPGGAKDVTWSAEFTTDTPGVTLDWKWAAAVYTRFAPDYGSLNVKPLTYDRLLLLPGFLNSDRAGTPANFAPYVVGGARGGGVSNDTGGYTGSARAVYTFGPTAAMTDSALGPNGTIGCESSAAAAFSGFEAEITPGHSIAKVEAVLEGYAAAPLANDLKINVFAGGQPGKAVTLSRHAFDSYIGSAGTVYLDITAAWPWQWADFANGLQLFIDQSGLNNGQVVCYDAVGLRVTSVAGSDSTGDPVEAPEPPAEQLDGSRQENVYNQAIGAAKLWNATPMLQGRGVTVAVVDSGIFKTPDLQDAKIVNVNFNQRYHGSLDGFGHGTFVAGVIGDSGKQSGGRYMGVAPRARLINARVSDDQGMVLESDLVAALQWVLAHKDAYHIRVVNLSLNSSQPQSYNTSPLDAACEILWFNGIVVVVSAGNNGSANLYPPANDPFVITVGATDDAGTVTLVDDQIASFSAYGLDESGQTKPDLVAPGVNIIGLLPDNHRLTMGQAHPNNRIDNTYFRMSGTSVSAPAVSGAVALLLENEPDLTPDQVKYRLKATAAQDNAWPAYDPQRAGAGYLDIYAAVNTRTTETANTNMPASALLWTGSTPVLWSSVNWTSVNWTSVNWTSVNWTSVNWTSVNWTSDHWDP